MWYVLSIIVSLVLLILFIILTCQRDNALYYILGVIFGVYFFVSFIVIATNPTLRMLKKDYAEAKYKCEILKTDVPMHVETVLDFKEDIEDVNETIDRHRKYYNNWYLKPLFYKEMAELNKLNCDTINVKIVAY